jgi:hypothetical protein
MSLSAKSEVFLPYNRRSLACPSLYLYNVYPLNAKYCRKDDQLAIIISRISHNYSQISRIAKHVWELTRVDVDFVCRRFPHSQGWASREPRLLETCNFRDVVEAQSGPVLVALGIIQSGAVDPNQFVGDIGLGCDGGSDSVRQSDDIEIDGADDDSRMIRSLAMELHDMSSVQRFSPILPRSVAIKRIISQLPRGGSARRSGGRLRYRDRSGWKRRRPETAGPGSAPGRDPF